MEDLVGIFQDAMATDETEQVAERQMDFRVQEEFTTRLPYIMSNLAEVKEWAIEQTKADANMVLTSDEDFTNARNRCADINRAIKNLNDKRIEVKREYMKPYTQFEEGVKEVTGILETAHSNLWGQVTAKDKAFKDAKLEKIKDLFVEKFGSNETDRLFSKFYDKKWLNSSFTEDKIKDAIAQAHEQFMKDLAVISRVSGDDTNAVLTYYLDGNSVSACIEYADRLHIPKPSQAEVVQTEETEETDNETISVDFRVTCTKAQLQKLKQFLLSNKIKYGKVPKEKG